MKIVLIVPGGVDRSRRERVIPVLLALIERLARRHTVHVVALRQYSQACTYPLLGATVHNLGSAPAVLRRVPGGLAWNGWRRLMAVLREIDRREPVDVLHGFWGASGGLLAALAGRCLGRPAIVHLAGGELVRLPDIGYGGQRHWRGRLRLALALRLAQRVVVASEFMRALARVHGIEPELVPLGVDTNVYAAGAPLPDGPPWRLLHVASLNRVKDLATVLRAIVQADAVQPGVHLDVVGEDTLGGEMQVLAVTLGLGERVTFHGFVPAGELVAFYRRAHLLVLASRHEAGPVVMLEAAACGVPTVATAVGYAADWAPERAWAVPVGDSHALAQAILALLRDRAERERIGRAAQAWTQSHNADWTAAQYEALYEQVCR